MIETVCPHCGNKKSFEDSYAGRTFRCPICKEPVTIQNLVEMVQQDEESHVISFDDQLNKAEEEKKQREKQEVIESQIEQLQLLIQQKKKEIKRGVILLAFGIICSIACISDMEIFFIPFVGMVITPLVLIYLAVKKRNNALNEIEQLKSQLKK